MNKHISSYRLGDLIFLNLSYDELNELKRDYPNSLGAKYINKMSEQNYNKLDLITSLVIDELKERKHLLPEDIHESNVIHVRLGDVVAGNESHELLKRPISIEELNNVVPKNHKTYIIGKCFFAKTSSTNYDECINKSNEYLNIVKSNFEAIHLNNNDADIDLLIGISSKTFISGKGYFSKLITEIRKKLNLNSIELYKLSPDVINGNFYHY